MQNAETNRMGSLCNSVSKGTLAPKYFRVLDVRMQKKKTTGEQARIS
jgi:hypothetical protein